MFGSLKENLEACGLELSAGYMMSDFELAIRDSFISHFPDVEAKGCAFHFAAAIIKKVARNGFKGQYSDPKCAAFRGFIRGMTGIVNVPPLRLKEAIRNLYILADKLTGRQRSFSISLIKYFNRTWVNGHFPPSTWMMFDHQGETTNNQSEGM